MDKQLPTVIAVGELWLFIIGMFASVLLLGMLMIPFLSKVIIPTRVWIRGALYSEELMTQLITLFRRDGYEVGAHQSDDPSHSGVVLTLHADSTTYTLNINQVGQDIFLTLSSDGVDLSTGTPQSILTSAGPGWLTLRLERHLLHCLEGVALRWGVTEDQSLYTERPLGPLARYVVTMAPWR